MTVRSPGPICEINLINKLFYYLLFELPYRKQDTIDNGPIDAPGFFTLEGCSLLPF